MRQLQFIPPNLLIKVQCVNFAIIMMSPDRVGGSLGVDIISERICCNSQLHLPSKALIL